jgi:hypothetical protein
MPETVAVIDFETTGMSPAMGARATEVAAVLVRGGEIVGRFQSLMRSGAWVPPFIEQLTGISNAMLDRAPRSAVVTADSEVECDLLKVEDFERLADTHPRINIVLLRNLALEVANDTHDFVQLHGIYRRIGAQLLGQRVGREAVFRPGIEISNQDFILTGQGA